MAGQGSPSRRDYAKSTAASAGPSPRELALVAAAGGLALLLVSGCRTGGSGEPSARASEGPPARAVGQPAEAQAAPRTARLCIARNSRALWVLAPVSEPGAEPPKWAIWRWALEEAQARRIVELDSGSFDVGGEAGRERAAWIDQGQLWVCEEAAADQRRAVPDACRGIPSPMRWSPDGATLAWAELEDVAQQSGTLCLYSTATDKTARIPLPTAATPVPAAQPIWSPGGEAVWVLSGPSQPSVAANSFPSYPLVWSVARREWWLWGSPLPPDRAPEDQPTPRGFRGISEQRLEATGGAATLLSTSTPGWHDGEAYSVLLPGAGTSPDQPYGKRTGGFIGPLDAVKTISADLGQAVAVWERPRGGRMVFETRVLAVDDPRPVLELRLALPADALLAQELAPGEGHTLYALAGAPGAYRILKVDLEGKRVEDLVHLP